MSDVLACRLLPCGLGLGRSGRIAHGGRGRGGSGGAWLWLYVLYVDLGVDVDIDIDFGIEN